MARKRCRVICLLSVGPPGVIPMKSSRCTLMWDRAVACVCGDRNTQSLLASSVAANSCYEVSGGFVSTRLTRWCGGAVWRMDWVSSDQCLTVLVVEQKKAEYSTYSMGIERRNPTSCSSLGVAFGTRNATDGMSSRRTQMRMYALARKTLLREVGPILGVAVRMRCRNSGELDRKSVV